MLESRIYNFLGKIIKYPPKPVYSLCSICQKNHSTQNHATVLKELSCCSYDSAVAALNKNRHILKMTPEQMKNGIMTLQGLGIKAYTQLDLLPLLKNHLLTIRNRMMVLEEAGFDDSKITCKLLERYLVYTKLQIEVLKKRNYIKPDVDVMQKMAQYLDLPDEQKQSLNGSDGETLIELKRKLLRVYLKWKLDMEEEKLIEGGRLMYRLQNKSLREMMRNTRIADRLMDIRGKRLKKNWYLLFTDPDNSLEIFKKLPEIAGVPIKVIVNTRPKIITCPVDHLIDIKKCFKDFNIPGDVLMKRPEVLTLTSDTISKRLKELSKVEFFRICLRHPRFLDLVYYHKKAIRRIKLLQEMKIQFASLHTMSSTEKIFEKFFELGSERPRGMETQYYLCSELGLDKKSIKTKMSRQPYWVHVPVVQVASTLTALLELGYTKEEIIRDLQIIFYPKDKIQSHLSRLRETGEELDCCRDSEGSVRRELEIKLALYYMEKEVNFSGEGLWEVAPSSETQPTAV